MRPAAPAKPRTPRKQAEKRAVTGGIVCFCGERFTESQALEFMLHLRAEVGEVLEWRRNFKERHRKSCRGYRQRRWREDPEFRAKETARTTSPEANEKRRERYALLRSTPGYQPRKRKPLTDEQRERRNERRRERRAREKAEREDGNAGS
jgi:hypothetical protein